MKIPKSLEKYYFQTHFDESFCWLENMPTEDNNKLERSARPKRNAFQKIFRNRFRDDCDSLVKISSD